VHEFFSISLGKGCRDNVEETFSMEGKNDPDACALKMQYVDTVKLIAGRGL